MPLKMRIKKFLTFGWINLKKPTLVMTKSLQERCDKEFHQIFREYFLGANDNGDYKSRRTTS